MPSLPTALVLGSCLLLACGGSAPKVVRATEPLDPAQAALFSDGVDLLDNPALLQDSWRLQWSEEAERLAEQSQLIARATVTTVRSEQDPDQRTTLHLVLRVDEVLVGEHSGSELVLRSREGAAGYGSVKEHGERLLRTEVIAFVRWALEDGREVAHFHLARPSTPLLNAVDRRAGKDQPRRVRIVEHTQE